MIDRSIDLWHQQHSADTPACPLAPLPQLPGSLKAWSQAQAAANACSLPPGSGNAPTSATLEQAVRVAELNARLAAAAAGGAAWAAMDMSGLDISATGLVELQDK